MKMKLYEDTQFNSELHKICNIDLPESKLLDDKLNIAYAKIYEQAKKENNMRRKNNMKAKRFSYIKAVTIAAGLIIMIFGGIGVANPALASNIPFIGKIFSYLEEKVSYPGNYSENAVTIEIQEQGSDEGAEGKAGNNTGQDNEYVQRRNGITVAVTELSRDNNKLYMALRIVNEEGFPGDFQTEFPEGGLSTLSCSSSAVVHREGQNDVQYGERYGNMPVYYIEGEFQDKNTFVGIAMLEFADFAECTKLDVTFHSFWGLLSSTHEIEGHVAGEDETVIILENDQKTYEGPWEFTFDPGKVGMADEFIVDQKNEDGFGIFKVVRSAYEITAEPILPEGVDKADYIVSIWDDDGNPLESHGSNVEQYSTYGQNIDEITVYLMEFETWVECKGENVNKQAENAIFTINVALE